MSELGKIENKFHCVGDWRYTGTVIIYGCITANTINLSKCL